MIIRFASLRYLTSLWLCLCLTGTSAIALAGRHPMEVVATTGMLADAMQRIGGDRVAVTALMGPGVDPHTYRQTRSDIVRMVRADLVVSHGLHLEAQLEPFLVQLEQRTPVVALAERLDSAKLLRDEDYPERHDPHVWMDPRLWADVVLAGAQTLSRLDPEGRPSYEANAKRYLAELEALAAASGQMLARVPPGGRVLVTAHDAFRYFGRAYDYEVVAIQGISTESEASLNRIEQLVELLVSRGIGAIFVESSVNRRNIQALIEGAAARGHKVRIGGELFSDAMGAPGTPEGTYLGMFRHNVQTIATALPAPAAPPADAPEN
ncbi:MAG: metal ABC transporter solute-binding protein, Zn/Mn family [Pigmentiphaga sp.]